MTDEAKVIMFDLIAEGELSREELRTAEYFELQDLPFCQWYTHVKGV